MEKHFSDKVLRAFDGDFIINSEVLGTHFSGARLRIDAVLKPKNTSLWKNPNVAFGIEFKLKEKLNSTKNSTAWIKQCVDMLIQNGIIMATYMYFHALRYSMS